MENKETVEYVTKFYKFCYKHQIGSVATLSATQLTNNSIKIRAVRLVIAIRSVQYKITSHSEALH